MQDTFQTRAYIQVRRRVSFLSATIENVASFINFPLSENIPSPNRREGTQPMRSIRPAAATELLREIDRSPRFSFSRRSLSMSKYSAIHAEQGSLVGQKPVRMMCLRPIVARRIQTGGGPLDRKSSQECFVSGEARFEHMCGMPGPYFSKIDVPSLPDREPPLPRQAPVDTAPV